MQLTDRRRWLALYVLCLGSLMIVLDSTIVNVALPSIRQDLGFTESSLAWVVNAYMLTFGGCLLLGGRLGDLFGHRRLFLIGIAFFTLASLLCGIANSQFTLIAARAVQGFAGSIVAAVALSLVMNIFTEETERAKAMGIYGFVSAGGGSIGVFLGGVLTNSFDWHWIFLVNIPIGILVFILCLSLLPHSKAETEHRKVDIAGAVTVTTGMMLAVYAIVNGNQNGWGSQETIGLLFAAAAFIVAFLLIESKVRAPLMPLHFFKLNNLRISNMAGVLWAGGMFAWFFLSALYMQLVLGFSPLQVGLSFLPANLIMAAFSLGLSARIVLRFGIRKSLITGLTLITLGLLLFVRVPVDGNFVRDVLPNMLLLGFGCGIAFNPLLLAAMGDVKSDDSGLASGMVNTSFMMGGALGLAILASVASAKTGHLLATGVAEPMALVEGYQSAFLIGTIFAACATILVALFLIEKPASERAKAHGHH